MNLIVVVKYENKWKNVCEIVFWFIDKKGKICFWGLNWFVDNILYVNV